MRWILIGCASVVLFDAVGALAADLLDFEYALLLPISFAIYLVTAFMAARAENAVRAGALAGACVALADGTVGWAISWAIGPGAPDPSDRAAGPVTATALTVVATGAAIGLMGVG